MIGRGEDICEDWMVAMVGGWWHCRQCCVEPLPVLVIVPTTLDSRDRVCLDCHMDDPVQLLMLPIL